MKIAVGTLNDAKNNAVENIVKSIWKDAEFYRVETDSGIRKQPLNNEEAIRGAINRAKEAMIKVNSQYNMTVDYSIGLEGTVDSNKYGMFLHGWVAIVDKSHNIGLGQSGSIQLPRNIESRIKTGEELGPIMQELMRDDSNRIRQNEGTNGILTDGLYTRVKEFEDATRCALARFVNPYWYNAFRIIPKDL